MEHFPGQITFWAINLAFVNLKKKIEIISSIFFDHNVVRCQLQEKKLLKIQIYGG